MIPLFKTAVAVCLILTLFVAQTTFAAEIFFKTSPSQDSNENAMKVDVLINTKKTLNVVEGVISLKGVASTSLVAIDTNESVLTMWPVYPVYSKDEQIIKFTGGVPGGFSSEKLLFRVNLTDLVEPGDVVLNWVNGTAYLNDGKGTKEIISFVPSGDNTFQYSVILIGLVTLVLAIILFRYVYIKNGKK